jgi:hypothetical protein
MTSLKPVGRYYARPSFGSKHEWNFRFEHERMAWPSSFRDRGVVCARSLRLSSFGFYITDALIQCDSRANS